MSGMITARDALTELIALGRSCREAASFLSEQTYELRVHAWAFVNTQELIPFPPGIWNFWSALRWCALPDDDGSVSFESDRLSVVGNWREGRISYCEKLPGRPEQRTNIQGLRFDRLEFDSVKGGALLWESEVIGAVALPVIRASLDDAEVPQTGFSSSTVVTLPSALDAPTSPSCVTHPWSEQAMKDEIAKCSIANRDAAWKDVFGPMRKEHGWSNQDFRDIWSIARGTEGLKGRPLNAR